MDINELFPSRYLKPADLGDQEYPVTIAAVGLEEVHLARTGRTEAKPVVYFERARKGLILSAHNAHAIAALHGPETDVWLGRRVILYLERNVEAFGQRYDVVRVRPRVPPAASAGIGVGPLLLDQDEVDAGLVDDDGFGEDDGGEVTTPPAPEASASVSGHPGTADVTRSAIGVEAPPAGGWNSGFGRAAVRRGRHA